MASKDLKRRASVFRPCTLLRLIIICLTFWLAFFAASRLRFLPFDLAIFLSERSERSGLNSSDGLHANATRQNVSSGEYAQWEEKFRSAEALNDTPGLDMASTRNHDCDLSSGRWIYDRQRKQPYDGSCPYIFKGWNCIRNQKPNAKDITAWRWQPWNCNLPQLDAKLFLEHFRDRNIGFVGDSLNRNMFVSLVCTLKQVSKEVKKWRPAEADKAFTFLRHNLTLAYHRTNLLAHYERWKAKAEGGQLESLGYKEGYRIDVDVPQSSWAQAPPFHDILILNTGHWWWAPEKFNPLSSPMFFFKNGEPILPPKSPEEGLDLVLDHMLHYVEVKMSNNGLKFLRSQSPRHFEGGDWIQNGTCQRSEPLLPSEVDAFFAPGNNGPNTEMHLVNRHLRHAMKGTSFQFLDISYMSSFRADAHPSQYAGKVHEDCMHWCLPGVIDFWNDIFSVKLLEHHH